MKVLKELEKEVKILDCIPTLFSAMIIESLRAESDWIDKVKKDKELTKKQKDSAIMVMHAVGILEGEIFIAGCKYGDYNLSYLPGGSIIQKFIRRKK